MTTKKLSSFSVGETEVVLKLVLEADCDPKFVLTEFSGHAILKNITFFNFLKAARYYEDLVKLFMNNFIFTNYEKGIGTETYSSICTK